MSDIRFLLNRQSILKHLEKTNPHTKFIVYISGSIDYFDAVQFYDVLRSCEPVEKICLIIDSPGGDPDAAYKIVSLLRQYCKKLIAVVPFTAKSAATLITLGTDEIQMGSSSELGPIDPQIKLPKSGQGPAQAIRDCIDYVSEKIKTSDDPKLMSMILYPIIDKLDPWLVGRFERSVKAAKQYAHSLLSNGMLKGSSCETIDKIVEKLSEGYFSHSYVIDRNEASSLGLNVSFIDNEYWDLIWDLYYSYHLEIISSEDEIWYYIDTVDSIEEKVQSFNGTEDEDVDEKLDPEEDCEVSEATDVNILSVNPQDNQTDEMGTSVPTT